MDYRPTITWTRAKLAAFNRAYGSAVIDGNEQFVFEGHDFLVAYAKHLIEYLKGELQ